MTALQTLVVDDSASARTVLKRLLERKGAKVDMTESGSQALDYLRDHRPDVIFMDHTMPGMSGLDAIKAMREDPSTAGIPVIMYTSQSDEHYYQLALDNPKAGYHAFYQLIEHIGAGSLEQVRMPRMDLTNTLKGIEDTDIGEPKLDLELMTKYIQYMNLGTE